MEINCGDGSCTVECGAKSTPCTGMTVNCGSGACSAVCEGDSTPEEMIDCDAACECTRC